MNFIKRLKDLWDSFRDPLEVVINDLISLKLKKDKTYIYIDGKKFIQCMRLMINIPKNDTYKYDTIETIDDANKVYKKSLYLNKRQIKEKNALILDEDQDHGISPTQEFWGHCSNLQAWSELGYDHRVIASNLAFPLLFKLTKIGDATAKESYKEAIRYRIRKGNTTTITALMEDKRFEVFTPEEIKDILVGIEEYTHPQEADLAWNTAGIIHYDLEEYEQSINAFKNSVYINPLRISSWNSLAAAYYNRKDMFEKSIDALKHSVELDPNDITVWDMLAVMYKKIKNIPEAKRSFRQARKIEQRRPINEDFVRRYFKGHIINY